MYGNVFARWRVSLADILLSFNGTIWHICFMWEKSEKSYSFFGACAVKCCLRTGSKAFSKYEMQFIYNCLKICLMKAPQSFQKSICQSYRLVIDVYLYQIALNVKCHCEGLWHLVVSGPTGYVVILHFARTFHKLVASSRTVILQFCDLHIHSIKSDSHSFWAP